VVDRSRWPYRGEPGRRPVPRRPLGLVGPVVARLDQVLERGHVDAPVAVGGPGGRRRRGGGRLRAAGLDRPGGGRGFERGDGALRDHADLGRVDVAGRRLARLPRGRIVGLARAWRRLGHVRSSRMRTFVATSRASRRSDTGSRVERQSVTAVRITMRAGRSGSTCRKMNDVVTMASAISQAGNRSILSVNIQWIAMKIGTSTTKTPYCAYGSWTGSVYPGGPR